MERTINYSRISTSEKIENKSGLQKQNKKLKEYSIAKNMSPVLEISECYSGKNIDRPLFSQMMNDIRSGKLEADVLLVTRLDRLTRDFFLAYGVVTELLNYGIRVISIAEGDLTLIFE